MVKEERYSFSDAYLGCEEGLTALRLGVRTLKYCKVKG